MATRCTTALLIVVSIALILCWPPASGGAAALGPLFSGTPPAGDAVIYLEQAVQTVPAAGDGMPANAGLRVLPQAGGWTGTTSRGYAMSFTVLAGSTQWNPFVLRYETGCTGILGQTTISGPGNIANDEFGSSGGQLSFWGRFSSAAAASGTFTVSIPSYASPCGTSFYQTGTWTAAPTGSASPSATPTATGVAAATATATATSSATPTATATVTACQGVTEIPLVECQALAALYNSTNGPGWTNHTNWLANTTPSTWFGVGVASGHVSRIEMAGNQLQGAVPPELGNLSYLTRIVLNQNNLTGAIPAQLGNLANLTLLDFGSCQLTGALPPELAGLTKLQFLWVGGNGLSGSIPGWLGSMSSLTQIYLSSNAFTGEIPPEIGNLSNLTSLNLNSNPLTGYVPAALGQLSNLDRLDLNETQLSGPLPQSLKSLTKLRYFAYTDTNLCEPGDAAFQAWLGGIADLQRTYVICPSETFRCTAVTDIPQDECTALVEFFHSTGSGRWADRTGWLDTNQPCSWFGVTCRLGHVSKLVLPDNRLFGHLPEELTALPGLEELNLWGSSFWGGIPPELGSLANLQVLILQWSQLTGHIPPELGNLANLRVLALGENLFSGGIPAELGNLSKLQSLVMQYSQLDGAIPPELGKLSQLQVLELSANDLSGGIPIELTNLGQLTSLRVDSNYLSGPLPYGLSALALQNLAFDRTNLCEPGDAPFQAWLAGIPHLGRTNTVCPGTTFSCNAVTGMPVSECQGLTALYNATNGPGWSNHTGWLASHAPCSWYGVTCQAGHVSALDLGSNDLVGSIPAGLTTLPNLQGLTLLGNTFYGGIPRQLGSLAGLQALNLTFSQLTGAIPPELGNLGQLRNLSLGENLFSGGIPPQLGNLSNLQTLTIPYSRLTGPIPPDLGRLSQLQHLDLSANQLSGPIPPELGNLTSLVTLNLNGNQLSGPIPRPLGNAAAPPASSARPSPAGSLPVSPSGLGGLQRLNLSNNQLVGSIPSEFAALSALQYLSVMNNPMSGALPGGLTNLSLTTFDFSDTGLRAPGDAAFQAWLATIPDLSSSGLTAYATRVNAAGPAYTDTLGLLWQADQMFEPGGWGYTATASDVLTTSAAISSTADPALYQDARVFSGGSATQGYRFTVPPGLYTVTLKFAELDATKLPGERVFDIVIEGITRAVNFDIAGSAKPAGVLTAVDWTFKAPVSDGVLDIALVQRGTRLPLVNAVSVELAGRGYTFDDVPLTHPDWLEIEKVKGAGVTAGCNAEGTMFCPDGIVKREEIAVFIDRALGWGPTPAVNNFTDLANDYWATPFAETLRAHGVTAGCQAAGQPLRYCPLYILSKAEIATMIRAAAGWPAANPPQFIFADAGPGDWFTPHVEAFWAHTPGSQCGTSPLRFCPLSQVTRAYMAELLASAFGL